MRILRSLFAAAVLALAPVQAFSACWEWSLTAGSNATADSTINWSEGQSPSSVNDSARAMMARLAECRDDLSGKLLTTGTSTAYLLTTNQANIAATPGNGQQIVAKVHVANGASATLAVDGGTAFPIQSGVGTAVPSGTLSIGMPYRFTFSTSSSAWFLQDFYPISITAGSIITSMLSDNAVTYAKMQTVTNNRLLGNVSGGTAVTQEITIGSGLSVSGTTISAPAFPPAAAFKNLVIKVASNTTATVAADYVTTTNGSNYQTTAVSCTINLASTGINALDTGSIASSTWYYIWIDAKADGTTGCTASLQSTANATFLSNLPSTYTYYARVGAVRTAPAVAQLLGTWQFGRRAQYVVGLAQTTAMPIIGTGVSGNLTVPTWVALSVSSVVPETASVVLGTVTCETTGTRGAMAAPNNSYGAVNSATNPPPVSSWGSGTAASSHNIAPFSFLLESSNIYWANDTNGGLLLISGWEDNI